MVPKCDNCGTCTECVLSCFEKMSLNSSIVHDQSVNEAEVSRSSEPEKKTSSFSTSSPEMTLKGFKVIQEEHLEADSKTVPLKGTSCLVFGTLEETVQKSVARSGDYFVEDRKLVGPSKEIPFSSLEDPQAPILGQYLKSRSSNGGVQQNLQNDTELWMTASAFVNEPEVRSAEPEKISSSYSPSSQEMTLKDLKIIQEDNLKVEKTTVPLNGTSFVVFGLEALDETVQKSTSAEASTCCSDSFCEDRELNQPSQEISFNGFTVSQLESGPILGQNVESHSLNDSVDQQSLRNDTELWMAAFVNEEVNRSAESESVSSPFSTSLEMTLKDLKIIQDESFETERKTVPFNATSFLEALEVTVQESMSVETLTRSGDSSFEDRGIIPPSQEVEVPFNGFTVPQPPIVRQNVESRSSNYGIDQQSLQNDTELWMPGFDFAAAGNATEWDDLMSRGTGAPRVNRWERDSLYQKFDPLVSRRSSIMPKPKTPVHKLPRHDESIDENRGKYSGESFYTAKENQSLACSTPSSSMGSSTVSPKTPTEDSSGLKVQIVLNETPPTVTDDSETPNVVDDRRDESTTNSPTTPTEYNEIQVESSELQNIDGEAFVENMVHKLRNHETQDKQICSLNENIANLEDHSRQKAEEEKAKLEAVEEKLKEQMIEIESLEAQLKETEDNTELFKLQSQEGLSELNIVEESFAEVLLSYESGKVFQKNFESNQKILNERVKMLTNARDRRQEKLDHMQRKVDESLARFKRDSDARLKEVETENMKLKAKMRMAEMTSRKLESEIEQTGIETDKLRALCDEMIRA